MDTGCRIGQASDQLMTSAISDRGCESASAAWTLAAMLRKPWWRVLHEGFIVNLLQIAGYRPWTDLRSACCGSSGMFVQSVRFIEEHALARERWKAADYRSSVSSRTERLVAMYRGQIEQFRHVVRLTRTTDMAFNNRIGARSC